MSYLDDRIEKVRNAVLKKADAMLVTDDITRAYIFGFRSTAGYGYLSKNLCELYLDFRYYEKAKLLQQKGGISDFVTIRLAESPRSEILKKLIVSDKAGSILFENKRMTFEDYEVLRRQVDNDIELCKAEDVIEKIRAVKDDFELARICEAQRITDLGFSHICSYIKRGMTENDIALELEFFMRKNGAEGLAFNTICVSGTKSSMPHGEPDDTIVGDGFLTLDFGARVDGYCADMTRTLCVGTPNEEMKKIYDTVLSAQQAAFSQIKANVLGKTVDDAARNVIYNAGYKGCFGHSTGHSLGLEIHEKPCFSPSEERTVPSGAVLSVEPGIYIEGKYGVRIEDIVFLTENGYKNLTNSTKEFIIIK